MVLDIGDTVKDSVQRQISPRVKGVIGEADFCDDTRGAVNLRCEDERLVKMILGAVLTGVRDGIKSGNPYTTGRIWVEPFTGGGIDESGTAETCE